MKLPMYARFFAILALAAPSVSQGWDEGLKIYCNSEHVIGREAHRDFFYTIPRVVGDRLQITVLSQDLTCGRRQDSSGRLVYGWNSTKNKEMNYIVEGFAWASANTTVNPIELGSETLSWDSEIRFEPAPAGVLSGFPKNFWEPGNLTLVTLSPRLSDILGDRMADDLLNGRTNLVRVNLVARREFYSGGERFVLEIRREPSNGRLYSKLIKI